MTNQQIIDFIKSQLQGGINKEAITKELLTNGWTIEDINESFKVLETPAINQINNLATVSIQKQNNSKKIILIVVIVLLLVAIAFFVFYYLSLKTKSQIVNDVLVNENQNTEKVPVIEVKQDQKALSNLYANDEYHFSFSYPKDVVPSKGKEGESNLLKIDFAYNVYMQNKTTGLVASSQFPLGSMLVGKKTYQQYVEMFKKSKDLNNISEKKIEKNGLAWNTVSVIDKDNSPAMNIAITEKDGLNYTLFLLNNPLVNGKEVISGQNEMVKSTTEMFINTFIFTDDISTPKSSDAFNDAFKVSFRNSFIQSCQKEAGPASIYCGCMGDYMINTYTVIQLIEFTEQPDGAGLQQAFADGASHCSIPE